MVALFTQLKKDVPVDMCCSVCKDQGKFTKATFIAALTADPYGVECVYHCSEHHKEWLEKKTTEVARGKCMWCGEDNVKLLYRKDPEVMDTGQVYEVCVRCVRKFA